MRFGQTRRARTHYRPLSVPRYGNVMVARPLLSAIRHAMIATGLAALPHAAVATPAIPLQEVQVLLAADSGDTAWLLAATALLIAAGLATAWRAGSRTALTVASLLGVLWLLIGYSLAFAPGSAWIGGVGALALTGLADVRVNSAVPESAYALWEGAVALFAFGLATLAVAPRARSGWLAGLAALWLLMAYAPIAHWLRSDGWLAARGVLDGGGGVSVLLAAGVSALVLTRFIGEPRLVLTDGRWAGAPLAGALVLVAASPLTASDDAATALLTALAGALAGTLVWAAAGFGLEDERAPHPAIGGLTGLAVVSVGAGAMGLVAAMALGAVAAAALLFALRLVRHPTQGVAVGLALGGGAGLGALLAPLVVLSIFGGPGFLENGPGLSYTLGAQSIALLVVVLWSAVTTAIAALMVSAVVSPTLTRRETEAITRLSESDPPARSRSV